MAHVLSVSPRAGTDSSEPAFPALALLAHSVREMRPDAAVVTEAGRADVVVLDGRSDLAAARQMCRLLGSAGSETPVLLVLGEGGFAAVNPEWGVRDIMLDAAGNVLRTRKYDASGKELPGG